MVDLTEEQIDEIVIGHADDDSAWEEPIFVHREDPIMQLPNYEDALVPKAKIVDYLLSFSHRDGRSKARFFTQFSFSAESWQEMAAALRQHAAAHEVSRTEPSPFGIRYIIEGPLQAPDGRSPIVRSVWFIETGEETPRLVTAYPGPRRSA